MRNQVTTTHEKIEYRATRQPQPNGDGTYTWRVEYKQSSDYEWDWRGKFLERDGVCEWKGRTFDDADHALRVYAREH